MPENYNYLFQYLKKEGISIDKDEFEFQVQSHPDYPSLLSISDTLNFLNINNGAMRVDSSEIELLPERFIAYLSEEKNKLQLCFVEKKGSEYVYIKDKKTLILSQQDLEARWENIVLLAEKSEIELTNSNNKLSWIIFIWFLAIFILVLYQSVDNLQTALFSLFPIFGILFSVAALKDLFGTKNKLLNSFCNITTSTSCTNIVNSTKLKIFKYLNFSDLSIVFFTSQFVGLLVFLFIGNTVVFFSIQKVLLGTAVPILFLSLYYQKFVEKKWCPICLAIITIVFLELWYVLLFHKTVFEILLRPLINMGLVIVSVALVWLIIKNFLTQHKELKEFQLKGIRFMRNYEIFKNTLLASNRVGNDLANDEIIVLGNAEAPLRIILVTSPFCGYCKEAHFIIEEILKKHHNTVCVDIRFNFNCDYGDEKSREIHQQLVAIYYEAGQDAFSKALHNWFENKDENKLDKVIIDEGNIFKINMILEKQFNWNKINGINYTPAIIINQFVFPGQYEINELIHFIAELAEDECFNC